MDYPFTGAGFEAFTPTLFDHYAPNPRDVHGPHSVYFGVLAEHGIPGITLYMTVLASCFLSLRRIRRDALYSADEQTAGYAMMLQISLIGFMISGAFLGRAYFDYYFTLVACVAILKQSPCPAPLALEEEEVVAEGQPA